jgi:HD superfamily phosphohydrolase YqeK
VATLHPLITAAAEGRLPDWAEASKRRRKHVARVSELMGTWAERAGLSEVDRVRWRAAGLLHDALRDADHDHLRTLVSEELREHPGKMLHGPAAAARLREEGVDDEPLLLAIAWHTLGHPDFDALGKALYLADYTEPGRNYESKKLAAKRDRVPAEMDAVLLDVATDRVRRSIKNGRPLLDPTVGFWNRLVDGAVGESK